MSVPCKNVYKCILDKPFVTILNVIPSSVHLKVKFHNLHGEPIMGNVDLIRIKRIYQVSVAVNS